MSRLGLYVLPVWTVTVVAFALLVVGAPSAEIGAQLYGGPTEGVTRLAWRLQAEERFRGAVAPARIGPVAVEVMLTDGRRSGWHGEVDAEGMAAVDLPFSGAPVSGPVSVRVTAPALTQALASGQVRLLAREWAAASRWRGGWFEGRQTGALQIRVAPGRGVLAVPFRDPLVVEVRYAGRPVPGAQLQFAPEGLNLAPTSAAHPRRTDQSGRALVPVKPLEQVCALRVTATSSAGLQGEWYSTLPVVLGALHASLQNGELRVVSPIPRKRAYFAVISEHARLAGGPLTLQPDQRGGAVQLVPLPQQPATCLWAVVSSEPELSSVGTVGWPIQVGSPDSTTLDRRLTHQPKRSLVVPDRLLLDGFVASSARSERRQQRARALAAAFVAAALTLVLLLMVQRVRESQTRLQQHLTRAGVALPDAERIEEPKRSRLFTLLVALLCVVLGFVMIGLLVLYRNG
jgi:hypothetical protein